MRGGELAYAGNVGTGFTEDEIERLLARFGRSSADEPPFARSRRCRRCGETTSSGSSRSWSPRSSSPSGRTTAACARRCTRACARTRIRAEVRREEPLPTEIRRGKRVLELSNLDKPFWPEEGITKGDLIAYYRDVAPVLVPHLRGRPFTMKRYPDGWQGKHFFQKDAPSHMPDVDPHVRVPLDLAGHPREADAPLPARRRRARAPLDGEHGLHRHEHLVLAGRQARPRPTGCSSTSIRRPDVGFPEVVRVALLIKEVLDALGLAGFPKTSGADGFHVLVPVARRYTYDQTREFAEIVAGTLARLHRGLVTTEWAKAKRRGVLDRREPERRGEDDRVAPTRCGPGAGAPVSTPLRWDEVDGGARPGRLHDGGRARRACSATATSSQGVLTTRAVARQGARARSEAPSPGRRARASAGSSRSGRSSSKPRRA